MAPGLGGLPVTEGMLGKFVFKLAIIFKTDDPGHS